MAEQRADSLPPTSPSLCENAIIAGKYRLVSELGAGGMGVVWSATHETLGHRVAIKFLLGAITASDEGRARFDREARLAARLGEASRHITRVIDHGVTADRVPYLVMELLRGEALSALLKREKRVTLQFAARIVQQLARALHVAHSAGVIHRDLKPANIFVCTPEQGDEVDVKLLDFGVAKATRDQDEELSTIQGKMIGTPGYMSPEQVTCDRSIDARSDLWAVAAIVYKMVVGRSPFGTGAVQEIGLRILSADPLPPSTIWPDLPVEFDRWIERGLAKRPEHRFHSARELSDFLAAIAGLAVGPPRDTSSLQQTILAGTADEESPTVNAIPARARKVATRRRRPAAIAAALAAASLIVPLTWFARAPRRDAPVALAASTHGVPLEPQPFAVPAVAAPTHSPSPSPSIVIAPSPPPVATPSTRRVRARPTPSASDVSGWENKHEF